MVKISAYVITLNEEKRLGKTLDALEQVADEIVVVDSGSTDKTEEIARSHSKVRFMHHDWVSYANQKNFAQNQCKYDWLLMIDADEVLSDELIAEINEVKKDPLYVVYKIRIGDMFPGFKKPRRFTKMYNLERLYHKDYATMYPDLLTKDRIALTEDVRIGQLKGLVHHYSYLAIANQINKLNHFTNQVLETALSEGKHYSRIRLITEFFRQFLCYYFIKRQFLNGRWGFIASVNLAYFRFVKIAKWFEWKATHSEK
ncbi:MAG: glycosyltransferase family 2 protein [Alphaproteobacteria bacterium]|nr:glycosyltransferase family 2 protein [Alphaproteobacteria bacterium]